MPLGQHTDTGKTRLESKAHMAMRGVASPDYADALVYAFAEGVRGTGWATDPSSLEQLTAALRGGT